MIGIIMTIFAAPRWSRSPPCQVSDDTDAFAAQMSAGLNFSGAACPLATIFLTALKLEFFFAVRSYLSKGCRGGPHWAFLAWAGGAT